MDIARVVTRLPVVRDLPPTRLKRITAVAQFISLKSGDVIWERGEAADLFTFLVSGQVRLVTQMQEPRNLLIDIIDTPGALVCVPAVCGAAPYCCHAVCTRKTGLLSIPREHLMQEELSPVGALLLQQSSRRALTLCRRLREVAGSKVPRRVAAVLLRLADERGTPYRDLTRIPKTISRRELAGLSGCATETLIRELARLEQMGAVSRNGRDLLVDVSKLADYIYGEQPDA